MSYGNKHTCWEGRRQRVDDPSRTQGSYFKTIEWGEGVWLQAQRVGRGNVRLQNTGIDNIARHAMVDFPENIGKITAFNITSYYVSSIETQMVFGTLNFFNQDT